jgi:hypothetical protein
MDRIRIGDAANMLGRELCAANAPHVVGVAVRRSNPNSSEQELWVDIDSLAGRDSVPQEYHGYDVHVRIAPAFRFA